MGIKIRKGFNEIISIHQRVINSLKSLKARQDRLYSQYQEKIEEEISIPSNKYMHWTQSVQPFMDLVVSSKASEYELLVEYDKFIKELVGFEADSVITEERIWDIEHTFDRLVETIYKLEEKIVKYKMFYTSELNNLRVHTINLNQKLKKYEKDQKGLCKFCGVLLDHTKGDLEEECVRCNKMDEKVKPFLEKPDAPVPDSKEDSPYLVSNLVTNLLSKEKEDEEPEQKKEPDAKIEPEPEFKTKNETDDEIDKDFVSDRLPDEKNEDDDVEETDEKKVEKLAIMNKKAGKEFQKLVSKFEDTKKKIEKDTKELDGDEDDL